MKILKSRRKPFILGTKENQGFISELILLIVKYILGAVPIYPEDSDYI
jgi:hypothetical protein